MSLQGKHPNTKPALAHWYGLMEEKQVLSFAELRMIFQAADQVGKLTVFNISGSLARLIAAIH